MPTFVTASGERGSPWKRAISSLSSAIIGAVSESRTPLAAQTAGRTMSRSPAKAAADAWSEWEEALFERPLPNEQKLFAANLTLAEVQPMLAPNNQQGLALPADSTIREEGTIGHVAAIAQLDDDTAALLSSTNADLLSRRSKATGDHSARTRSILSDQRHVFSPTASNEY
jgi:hypothetical protein